MARELTPAQCQRVEQLFDKLFSVSPESRRARLESECPDDPLVRLELDGLFAVAERSSSAWGASSPAKRIQNEASQALASFGELSADAMVGEYRIVRLLAHGGMGAVYEAQQESPRRRVALKLVRPGLLSPAIQRRFDQEASILGRLEHAGIARIYQAGITLTPLGEQPFFAMEFISGQPLDEFAREKKLDLKQRLTLLIEVCQAVHYAHIRGVIHRDLKPANILVTADAHPKVLDFGVAHATDSDMQSTTLHTQTGDMVGTLPYMSPEQAAGKVNELDASSDVYSLGVITYELLSGKMPYELVGKPMYEAARTICEDQPTRLGRLSKGFRGDIETIVGKAMEKEKARRYASASELAEDFRRYSDCQPIAARPPSTWYHIRKFSARNKVLVGGVAAVFAALAVGMIGTSYGMVRANQQRRVAEQRAAEYRAVSQFLEKYHMGNRWQLNKSSFDSLSVLADTDRALNDGALDDQPLVKANMYYMLGNAYRIQARHLQAEKAIRKCLELREGSLNESHMDLALARLTLGGICAELKRPVEAEPLLLRSLAVLRNNPRTDVIDLIANIWWLGRVERLVGPEGLAESEKYFKELLPIKRPNRDPDDEHVGYVLHELALTYAAEGRLPEADLTCHEAITHVWRAAAAGDRSEEELQALHWKVAEILWTRTELFKKQGRWSESVWACTEGLRVLDVSPLDTGVRRRRAADFAIRLGDVYMHEKDFVRADDTYQKALARERIAVRGDSYMATVFRRLCSANVARGKLSEAERACREALTCEELAYGPRHVNSLGSLCNLANLLKAQGKQAESNSVLDDMKLRASDADLPAEWQRRLDIALQTGAGSIPSLVPELVLVVPEGSLE